MLDLRPFVVMYLLLQTLARPKVPEGGDGGRGDGERFPMFRTGTGRAVSVSESSIRKARSVLGGAGDTDTSGSIRHGMLISCSFMTVVKLY